MRADELGKLWDLHQQGALTGAEYAAEKARLLRLPLDEPDHTSADAAFEPARDDSDHEAGADLALEASITTDESEGSHGSWLLIVGVVLAVLAVAGCFIGLMESLPATVKLGVMALFVAITVLGGIIKWLRG